MTEKISTARLRHPVMLLALGLGAGLVPRAPGTAGTVLAVPLYLLLAMLPVTMQLVITALLCLTGIAICGVAARRLGVPDHPAIVFDEVAGYFVTMLFAPTGWQWVVTGFVLFRLFDIGKPWPIRWLDRHVHGGLGIMLDDLLAGVFAGLVMLVLVRLV